jgi:hypothetical protein
MRSQGTRRVPPLTGVSFQARVLSGLTNRSSALCINTAILNAAVSLTFLNIGITDTGMQMLRKDPIGAGVRGVVEHVVGVETGLPSSRLHQTLPHDLRWCGDRDRPRAAVLATRHEIVAGHDRRERGVGSYPPAVPCAQQRCGREQRKRGREIDEFLRELGLGLEQCVDEQVDRGGRDANREPARLSAKLGAHSQQALAARDRIRRRRLIPRTGDPQLLPLGRSLEPHRAKRLRLEPAIHHRVRLTAR